MAALGGLLVEHGGAGAGGGVQQQEVRHPFGCGRDDQVVGPASFSGFDALSITSAVTFASPSLPPLATAASQAVSSSADATVAVTPATLACVAVTRAQARQMLGLRAAAERLLGSGPGLLADPLEGAVVLVHDASGAHQRCPDGSQALPPALSTASGSTSMPALAGTAVRERGGRAACLGGDDGGGGVACSGDAWGSQCCHVLARRVVCTETTPDGTAAAFVFENASCGYLQGVASRR